MLKDLKMDNDTISRVKILAKYAGREMKPEESKVRRAMSGMLPEVWDVLVRLNDWGEEISRLTDEIRRRGDCLDLKHLAIGGTGPDRSGSSAGKRAGADS